MGTVVDVIRYPYRTTMRFYTDSAIETPVCWYFCSPEAKPLGCYTRFGSGLYGKDYMDRWEGVGEVAFGPLDFRANCCPFPGKARIGTPEQFAEGVSINDAPPPIRGLVDCSSQPETFLPFPSPRLIYFPTGRVQADPDTFECSTYDDPSPGYISATATLTMTCENDPSLNGSWLVTNAGCAGFPQVYRGPGISNYPFCNSNTGSVGIEVLRSSDDGTALTVLFSGTNLFGCALLPITGTPRPCSYTGSGVAGIFGNVTVSLVETAPFVPPPF